MTPVPIKATSFSDILRRSDEQKKVYDVLSPEDRAEVDEHNRKFTEAYAAGGIKGALAANLGVSPMVKHLQPKVRVRTRPAKED